MEICEFKIAKKLKEKGYPQKHMGEYEMLGPTYIDDGILYENGCITEVAEAYSAPTISQVLKWLREEKKIHVELSICGNLKYDYTIVIREEEHLVFVRDTPPRYLTYEQAALAGVFYCLNNLI